MTLFLEISIALVLAAFCGTVFYFFKQPTVVGFIVAGLIIGYFGYLNDQANLDLVESLSSIGVALLLFIVGLEMRVSDLKRVGLSVIIAGLAQVFITFGVLYWLCGLLGLATTPSFYISLALSFSSTVIAVKILSEKRDLSSLYGRLALGILLVQDLISVLVLIFLSGLANGGENITLNVFYTLLKGSVFILLAVLASRILPKFMGLISKSPELLYLFSLAWAVGISALFVSPIIGLSAEVGGLLAGLALAGSAEHFQISARLKPLRDFFLIILFIGLGARMLSGGGSEIAVPVLLLSLSVLALKPLLVLLSLCALGYKPRTSLLAGLVTSQVSEFSFIVIFLAAELGHVASGDVSLVAMIGIITIFISSYLIIYSKHIYVFLRPALRLLKFRKLGLEEMAEETMLTDHTVLIGVHRMGESILKAISNSGEPFVAVDFDPEVVSRLRAAKLPVIYGDVSDPEIQDVLGLEKARTVISTIPDPEDNGAVLEFLKRRNPGAKTILTAPTPHVAKALYGLGTDYVIVPRLVGGAEVARMITNDPSLSGLPELRQRDLDIMPTDKD
ncbi:MAG: hypothetical protein A2846_01415 [Candidatus Doudnabacteria bacterium RIFCSPHIGHO2_01_FULL_49_9]|uniref:RCK N-terminal domain-containing protein n=1 Tax=Candidatus Doudnabacteria bacterium RIFCSPHIGHO2_01_FULL_49_9 TaxID=1817827 RepID=A0A1F5P0N1_9BACT|nr:MAG: hypothetical protein A2846_01415 [Candidatus Doudnabacteria bacterium RIFCSPHIGHO2_01_FULL_49_9]